MPRDSQSDHIVVGVGANMSLLDIHICGDSSRASRPRFQIASDPFGGLGRFAVFDPVSMKVTDSEVKEGWIDNLPRTFARALMPPPTTVTCALNIPNEINLGSSRVVMFRTRR